MRASLASLNSRRALVFGLAALAAVMVELVPARAEQPPPLGVFHGGATAGIIRDATKVGGTLYAVGTWANAAMGGRIDGALWTFDGTNPVVRTALPDIGFSGNNLSAGEAISPDAQFVASQARSCSPPSVSCSPNGPTAVRVTRDVLTNLLTNVNLTPGPTFTSSNNQKGAKAISDDGLVLYGQVNWLVGSAYQSRVVRFDVSGATATVVPIYPQPALDAAGYTTFQQMVARAASSDGSVAVGSTFTSAPFVDTQAFRYVHGTGSTAVSLLPGGTWNSPIALTDDGNIVVAVGPSTAFPNREVYLADFSTGSETITPLGSPNEPWGFGAGGITADGSVVAMTSTIGCAPNVCRYGYFHNSNGWFQLTSAMAAAGMNLTGWQQFQIQGISADGTMVWGSGSHNGVGEGYVAEFPADFLKDFDVIPTAPTDTSIVGVWAADGTGAPDTSDPDSVVAFMADGSYYQMDATGFERGSYEFNGSSVTPTTRSDTNGDEGLSDGNGGTVSVSVVGDELRSPENCVFNPLLPDDCFVATRIVAGAGSIVGGWALGDATKADSSAVVVFTSGGKYFMAQEGDAVAEPGGRDGVEVGTYSWNGVNLAATSIPVDTNGDWGLSDPFGPIRLQLAADELSAFGGDDTGTFVLTRILIVKVATPAGTGVVVAPTDPSGNQSISLTFATVTAGGDTTVQTVDPTKTESAVTPPAGFSLGDPPVYYEISTTAAFTGPVNVCFNYGGIIFPSGTPRLYHYDNGEWMDITTSVDPATTTICGTTMSFSPFAIFVSPIERTGFYSPVSSVPGFMNTVKGGSTVPLKFNVYVNGVEKTDVAGLQFSVASVSCTPAEEDPVDAVTTGNTSLRYDAKAGHFIQNWKTPKGAGACLVVRITTLDDGLSIGAFFRTK